MAGLSGDDDVLDLLNGEHDEQDMGQGGVGDDGEANENEITEEDAWKVISAYFAERGLCRQQLDSFDCCLGVRLPHEDYILASSETSGCANYVSV
jgi:hypothetical protein